MERFSETGVETFRLRIFKGLPSDDVHESIIRKLDGFSKGQEKPQTSQEYRLIESIAAIQYGEGDRKLTRKGSGLEVLSEFRLFDVIHEAHINSGHGGRDKLTVALKKILWNA